MIRYAKSEIVISICVCVMGFNPLVLLNESLSQNRIELGAIMWSGNVSLRKPIIISTLCCFRKCINFTVYYTTGRVPGGGWGGCVASFPNCTKTIVVVVVLPLNIYIRNAKVGKF